MPNETPATITPQTVEGAGTGAIPAETVLEPTTPATTAAGSLIGGASVETTTSADTPDATVGAVPPATEARDLTWADLGLDPAVVIPEETQTAFLGLINGDLADRAAFAKSSLALHTQLMADEGQRLQDQWTETQTAWQNEIRNDPALGGSALNGTMTEVARLVDRYGTKELRQAMDLTGAGNHPEFVRFLHRIAKDINERPPVSGVAAVETRGGRETRLYGNPPKQQ